MMGHFNDVVNNLGDTLFGDGTNPEDFQQFLAGLEEDHAEAKFDADPHADGIADSRTVEHGAE